MIERMFDADSDGRISLRELLHHPWMCKDGQGADNESDVESFSDSDSMMDIDMGCGAIERVVTKADIARFCRKY